MGTKRVKIHANFQPKKCAKRYSGDDDRISQLPDDILVNILSLLSLKEAARSSVLSSRWINLWKHTPSLDFDAQSTLDKIKKERKLFHRLFNRERRRYVKWVNSVIQSHQSPTLKEFKICFPLDISSEKPITRWLEFAISRQVQRLDLDVQNYGSPSVFYCYPEEFLVPNSRPPSDSFRNLKELSFKSINLSGEAIESFLNNCPLLEQLIVHESAKTSKLEIRGPSLRLKHLEIVYCQRLESLQVVSAPMLTTLTLTSLKGVLLKDVPMLVGLTVNCDDDSISVRRLFSVLSCCTSQLETLNLILVGSGEETDELYKFPEMPKLKKLVIEFDAFDNESFIRLAALTRASPYLEEFVFVNEWFKCRRRDGPLENAAVRFRHEHLKVFKFCRYNGLSIDIEFVRYILENCIVVEKVIIDPLGDRLKKKQNAREIAKRHLDPLLPQHVKLVVL